MLRLYSIAILIVISVTFTNAQSKTKHRPKIGLVLSGGGAKGMAHVGLLKVLEEVGIKPDYITGTSMGSIVGGLYAIGYSASEIENILKKQDWTDVLSNEIPLKRISINEKDQYGQYFAEFPIRGIKVSLPKGLIYGQQIMNLLSHYTLPAYKIHDFNKLPIPFKCVATDITNGKAVVIDTGNIAIAMRSSMAIPSVFTPVQYLDKLLVDGGLIHNFPVSEIKKMGADIVIGEYTGEKLRNKSQLNSMVSILTQSAFFMGVFDAKKQKKLVNIYIEPNLDKFTPADFPKVDSIINCGEIAARKHIKELKALAKKLKQYDDDQKTKTKLTTPDSLVVESIVTVGISSNYKNFILGLLGITPNIPFSISNLEIGIDQIYGTRYFDKVYYSFNNLPNNKLQLVIHAESRPSGYISMSAHYDSEKQAGLLVNLLVRDLFINSSRLSITANIAENPGFQFDWFKYFGYKRRFTIGFQSNISTFKLPLYTNGTMNKLFKLNYSNIGVYTRYSIMNNTRFCIYAKSEHSLITPVVSEDNVFEKWLIKNKQISARFETNSLNKKNFPKNGIKASIAYQYNFDINYDDGTKNNLNDLFNNHFSNIICHFDSYKEVFNRFTFHNFFHAGLIFGENYSIVKNYYTGGNYIDYDYTLPFIGFKRMEQTYRQILIGGGGIRIEAFKNFFIEPKANLLISNQYLSQFFNKINDEKIVLGFGMELGYKTIIGPIVASISTNTLNYMVRGFFNVGYKYQF